MIDSVYQAFQLPFQQQMLCSAPKAIGYGCVLGAVGSPSLKPGSSGARGWIQAQGEAAQWS